MNKRYRRLTIAVALLLLISIPVWFGYRDWKRAMTDHALIMAIKSGNNAAAFKALEEGANGEARANDKPITFRESMLQMWDHAVHPHRPDDKTHIPALLLLYKQTFGNGLVFKYRPGPDPALVRALLDHGAKVNDTDEYNRSPLNYAAFFSDGESVRLLLERGANIESLGGGLTPLMEADVNVTQILLEHGARVDARNGLSETALFCAVIAGSMDKVRILIEHGAHVSLNDGGGIGALWNTAANFDQSPTGRKIATLLRKSSAK